MLFAKFKCEKYYEIKGNTATFHLQKGRLIKFKIELCLNNHAAVYGIKQEKLVYNPTTCMQNV